MMGTLRRKPAEESQVLSLPGTQLMGGLEWQHLERWYKAENTWLDIGVRYGNVRWEDNEIVMVSPITDIIALQAHVWEQPRWHWVCPQQKGLRTESLLFMISSCGHTALKTVVPYSFRDNFLAETEAVMFILWYQTVPFLLHSHHSHWNCKISGKFTARVCLAAVRLFSSKSWSEY